MLSFLPKVLKPAFWRSVFVSVERVAVQIVRSSEIKSTLRDGTRYRFTDSYSGEMPRLRDISSCKRTFMEKGLVW